MTDFTAWVERSKLLWARVFDEVITPAFEDEWKKRDEAHEEELRQRREAQEPLLKHINDLLLTNSRLTAENEAMKGGLVRNDSTPKKVESLNFGSGEAAAPTIAEPLLSAKYDELSQRCQDLSQKIKYLERKNQVVMQKNKDMKASVKAWQEYADRQAGRQKLKIENKFEDGRLRLSAMPVVELDRPCETSSPVSVDSSRTPLTLSGYGRSSPLPSAQLASTEHNVASPPTLATTPELQNRDRQQAESSSVTPKPAKESLVPVTLPTNAEGIPHSSPQGIATIQDMWRRRHEFSLPSAHPNSSQTTVDEFTDIQRKHSLDTTTANNDDDDKPEFVSERSLKRKRDQASRIRVHTDQSSDGTPIKPFHIKEEQSSPPTVHSLLRKETIDLDDVPNAALQTPRHLRSRYHNVVPGIIRHQRSSSASFSHGSDRPAALPQQTSRSFNSAIGIEGLNSEGIDGRGISEPTDSVHIASSILQPISPNALPPVEDEHPKKRHRENGRGRSKANRILAESGEEPPADENATILTPSLARTKLNQNFNDREDQSKHARHVTDTISTSRTKIKAEPGLKSSSVSLNTATNSTKGDMHQRRQGEAQLSTRDSVVTDGRPIWTLSTPEPRTSTRKSPMTNTSKSNSKTRVRLRNKPISELTLQDFKLNPTYNNGYSYAFSETVRKRGDRMCLPGCTNPQCCGSTFRVLAEAQAQLSPSQEESLLEDYLGDAYDGMCLTQMAADERAELVLQARTRKLAKDTGKHRQAYEGRRTPPGFWRVDFPSTQEQEEDRARAREMEKKQIEERWLEAQRRGGKWIFRDE